LPKIFGHHSVTNRWVNAHASAAARRDFLVATGRRHEERIDFPSNTLCDDWLAVRPPMPIPRKILLNPGPCTTSERVKRALLVPDLCPREKNFGKLLAAVRAKLLRTVNAEATHTAVLLAGSGTAAMEASLGSVVGPADRVLIIDNGAYGRRAEQIAQALGLPHRMLSLGWGEYPHPEIVGAALAETPAITHCFFVHHETTTGMLNPLDAIVTACQRRGVVTIVDAMSSLGGVPLDLQSTPADFVISSANKCLQGFPGLSFVLARRAALARLAALPRRSVYLHLHDNWRAQEETHQCLYTPPVQVLHALDEALDEFFEEGAAARHARYAACYATLLAGMKALGFVCLVPEAWHSKLLTAFLEPDHPAWSFDAMHDYLYERGITVYPGKLSAARTFRIANIGDLQPADLECFLAHLREFLASRGISRIH
jgi:2-aminoethylphosphonate aminotransferase